LGALLAFQYDNKLAIDGICGPATKKALKID
jgi:peptidoglycan hydrolase-like protein with peptidoglycan-binding domain